MPVPRRSPGRSPDRVSHVAVPSVAATPPTRAAERSGSPPAAGPGSAATSAASPSPASRLPSPPDTFSPRQRLIASQLAIGKPATEIAALLGCSPNHVTSLKADPRFRELVRHEAAQVREALLAGFLGRLQGAAEPSIDTLEELRDDALIPQVRLGAARTLLAGALQAVGPRAGEGGIRIPISGRDLQVLVQVIQEEDARLMAVEEDDHD